MPFGMLAIDTTSENCKKIKIKIKIKQWSLFNTFTCGQEILKIFKPKIKLRDKWKGRKMAHQSKSIKLNSA
jgi:hypothetical protein